MRILKLSEVAQMSPDEIVPCVIATVKQIYKPKKGGEGDNAYKFQDVILKDGDTEFKMTIKDRFDWDMPDNWKGKKVVVNSHQGSKGLTGVKIKDTSYEKNGKKVEQVVLWVTSTGEIALEGAEGDTGSRSSERSEPAPQSGGNSGGQSAPPATPPPAQQGGKPNFGAIKKGMLPLLNLYFLTFDGVEYINKCLVKSGKPEMDAEDKRAARATIFIECMKGGHLPNVPAMPLLEHLHVPGSPEAKAAEEAAKAAAAEAERKKKEEEERKRREEEERIAAANAAKRKAEAAKNDDEDVPF